MTEVEQPPPQNGIDISATDDDENSKTRPADIEQDMREMERRKRVEAIMGSKLFREELERIVDCARDSGNAAGILQQLSDIVGVPSSRVGSVYKASTCMLPINDIRGVESMGYAKGEKILRCKLAATFRLLDLYGWTQGLGAQITARLKVDQEYFLVNPYGLSYHEITASSLNKVDMQGNIVEQGTTNFGVNKSNFLLHSVVHAARPDIRCAIYIVCSPVVAISSLKTGLLPLTKDACVLGELSTYSYIGYLTDDEERNKLVRNLGPNSKVMFLTNHGALCCGETIEEAFFAACHIVQACETQLKLLPVGLDNLILIPEESRKIIYDKSRRPPEDLEKKFATAVNDSNKSAEEEKKEGGESSTTASKTLGQAPKWRVGGAEFEALMRMLDNAGYRTGYIYRHPLIKTDPPKPKNDVELPPAVSSLGYLLEEEELFRQGIWKKGELRKGGDRSRWLNSPNVYQKVEVLETGTPDPKKITKWVAEGSPTHSTPVRIEDPLQFVPVNTNPKEFKRVQQQIKDNRRADKISAGPQSHILEGVTWDEANRIKDATVSSAGDHVVLMGAASKGIIQRGFQHNATVYKAPYAKNPFDNVTDDELNEYKRTVERKKKSIHGEYTDTDFSESEALSSLPTSGAQQTKQTATTTTTTTATVSQSEPEDISEHQVMRIQTQQAPIPSQPEVVLSDASLSFINGERSHTTTNLKPPTGRDIKFQMPQDNNNNESFEISFHSLTLTKYHSAADDNYFNRNEEQRSYRPQDVQRNNLKLYESPEKQTLTSVSQLRNNLFIETQKDGRSQDLNLVEYTDTREHLYNKQGSGNSNKNPSKDDSENYIMDTNSQIKCNATQCSTPEICAAVFKSTININNRHDFNDTRNLRSNVDLNRNLGQSLYVTSSRQNDSNRKFTYPYRTVSHFGFNWPLQDPQPEHKHLTVNFDDKQKYIPLKRTVSYEEIFSTSRYLDLCEYCFEHIVRSKPEIMRYKTKLRNLFEQNCALYPRTKTSIEKFCLPSTNTNNEYGNKSLELDCYKFETYDSNTVFPFQLDKVVEIDESFNDYFHAQFIPSSTFNEHTHCATYPKTNIKRGIYSVPYARRSTSPEIRLLSADNTYLRQQNRNLDVSINNYNENKLNNTSISCNSNESNSNNCFTEIWEFNNLHNTSTDMSQNEKLCESSVNPKKLMNREERWRRKLEFQEIWEDHIIFAQNREYDMELVNGPPQNVAIIKSLEKNKEIYDGCCVLFPNCSFANNKLLDNAHLQQLFNKQDNMSLKIMEENNSNDKFRILNYNYINSVYNNNINLSNNAYTSKCPQEIQNNQLTTLTNDKNKEKFEEHSEAFNLFTHEREHISKICEVNVENCIENNSNNNSNENCADFSPLERKILEKIQVINSSKEDAILSKIENSIRNKITPHKLQSLLKEKTQLKNRRHKDKEKENCNFLTKINNIKPVGRARLLNSNKNHTPLRSHKINKVQLCLTESNKQVLKVTRSDRHNSISPHSKNFIKSEKLKRRNFILENIRNASTPRQTYHTKTNVDQKLQTHSNCSAFDKVSNLKKVAKSLVHSVETPHFIPSEKRKVPTDIYSFQSKLVKGSPRFWISLPQSSTTKFEESSSGGDRTFTNSASSCTMAILPHNIDTGSVTKVDTELNALGEEIQKIQPRLESYKRKLDDFGDRVTECFHNINECVSTHEKAINDQQNLKDHIVLHQYAEHVMCNVQTFSLSETED